MTPPLICTLICKDGAQHRHQTVPTLAAAELLRERLDARWTCGPHTIASRYDSR